MGKFFAKHYEGARKSVERVFGILFKRFRILHRPSRLLYKEDIWDVVRTCCILHNMIVRARRSKYTGTRLVRFAEDETRPPADIRRKDTPRTRKQQIDRWSDLSDGIESAEQHSRLQAALMEYTWQERGAEVCGIQENDGDDFTTSK
jgi:Plant transposon protein